MATLYSVPCKFYCSSNDDFHMLIRCLLSIRNTATVVTHTWQLHHSSHGNLLFYLHNPQKFNLPCISIEFFAFLDMATIQKDKLYLWTIHGAVSNFLHTLFISKFRSFWMATSTPPIWQFLIILNGNIIIPHMAILVLHTRQF